MKEAGLQTLLEEQNKLAAEKEGKTGSGTSAATTDGVNKVISLCCVSEPLRVEM